MDSNLKLKCLSQNLKLAVIGLVAASTIGCASINSVSLTPIPSNRSRVVQAEVSRTIFLAFNFDNDYINPLTEKLQAQCPNGVVSGILTKDEVIAYVIVFKRIVTATGYCNVTTASSSRPGARTPSSDDVSGVE